MDVTPVTLMLGALGVFAGPVLTYIIATKKLSGKIATSEASELWDEARQIRMEYREEIVRLRESEAECKTMLDKVKAELTKLQEQIDLIRQRPSVDA